MIDQLAIDFERADFRLSETLPFSWRRNLPPLVAKHTVFNYVATYNDFDRRFAEFLADAPDVLRFASLGTTEHGESGTTFRVDYLKPSGATGFYHPDLVVVEKKGPDEVNWIIETKTREWEGTEAKDEAIREWCERITAATNKVWQYRRVDQVAFEAFKGKRFGSAGETGRRTRSPGRAANAARYATAPTPGYSQRRAAPSP